MVLASVWYKGAWTTSRQWVFPSLPPSHLQLSEEAASQWIRGTCLWYLTPVPLAPTMALAASGIL